MTMNVAHCIHGLGLGGAQQIVKYIVGRADPNRHRFFVYTPLGGTRTQEVREAGATVRVIPRSLPRLDPLWIRALAKAFRRDEIDVVHTHLFGDALHGQLAARFAGKLPVVMTIHNVLEKLPFLQRIGYRWLVPRSSRAVACSKIVRESFIVGRVRRAEEIVTIPNGIEPPRVASAGSREQDPLRRKLASWSSYPILAAIGRLSEAKGYRYLLAALAGLSRSTEIPPRLVIIGDGPLRSQLESQAREKGIEDLVVFAGARPDVNELLHRVQVVVFSSLWEGLPVALLEAMAARRCIVGTEIPGILEAVRGNREAILVPPRDVHALCEGLRRATSDPELRRRLAEAAHRRFLEKFTAERMVAEYEAVYRMALGGSGNTAGTRP